MNRIGARAHDYGRAAPDALLGRIAADGWQTVQLAMTKCLAGVDSWDAVTPAVVADARRALAAHGLTVAVLGAYVELGLADADARGAAVAHFRAQLPWAKALGAGCVGSETTNRAKQPGVTGREAFACLERSLAAILPDAEALGVTVAVEPVYYHTLATPELTRQLLDDLQSPALAVILDPGNLFSPEEAPRQQALWQRAFDCFGSRIAAVHCKGVRIEGGRPVSCPLEASQVDLAAVLRLLRQTGREPPLLREEAVPVRAAADRAFLQGLLA